MTRPIEEDLRGVYAVVDEAANGTKAIPVVFVQKTADGSFGYGSSPASGASVKNKMAQPIETDAEGNAEIIDEDIDGTKAIPLVPVTKDENGRFVYAKLNEGDVEIPDGSVTTAKFAPDAKAPFATTADIANAIAWANVTGKPSAFPIADGAVTSAKIANGAVTDDKLAKKKVDVPDPLVPGMVIGTTLETSTLGLVAYSQGPSPDHLAMYQFGGQLAGADPAADSDLTTKRYVDGFISSKLSAVDPIADPANADAPTVAAKVNEILAALKG